MLVNYNLDNFKNECDPKNQNEDDLTDDDDTRNKDDPKIKDNPKKLTEKKLNLFGIRGQ